MGPITTEITTWDYNSLNKHIQAKLARSASELVGVGYMLKRMLNERLWANDYDSFDTYLQSELHMEYTAATRFIKACDKYGNGTADIERKYVEYSQSVLIEMMNMTPEQEEKVKPDMTVKQVREIKKPSKIVNLNTVKIVDGEFRELDKAISKYKEKEATAEIVEDKKCNFDPSFRCNFENLHEVKTEDLGELCTRTCCYGCTELCGVKCISAVDVEKHVATSQPEKPPIINLDFEEAAQEMIESAKPKSEIEYLREFRDKENEKLKQYIDVNKVEGVPKNLMRKQKLIVAALGNLLNDFEDIEFKEQMAAQIQPELPKFRNNDQRKAWLEDYKAWGLWYHDEHIDVNYYKYDFVDGTRLVVAEYPQREQYWRDDMKDLHYYHMVTKRKRYDGKTFTKAQYSESTDSETALIEFLKNLGRTT